MTLQTLSVRSVTPLTSGARYPRPVPRYDFRCGANCPPGPGYWPIDAPDLPSDLGWRNPTHTINRRAFAGYKNQLNAALDVSGAMVGRVANFA